MIYKLVEKGYIEKRISPNSDTEVCLTLTESGKIAYHTHAEYHEKSSTAFFKMLNDMPQEYQDYLIQVLKKIDQSMDEQLDKK